MKVTAITKYPHKEDGFVKAIDFKVTGEEIQYLEELYIPHKLVGVIAMNPVEIQAK